MALARDERQVNAVFDTIEPFAATLAQHRAPALEAARHAGADRTDPAGAAPRVRPRRRRGQARCSLGPPDLERLYARLEDEYELAERGRTLKAKLDVIGETARAFTEIIDADRSVRLEWTVVVLILTEIILSLAQMFLFRGGH